MLWPPGADPRSTPEDMYRLGPGLILAIAGAPRARAHFRAEYAPAAVATNGVAPAVKATIGVHPERGHGGHRTDDPVLHGTHKLARWHASVPRAPAADTMRVGVDVRGPLGLALVQSYVIEPLVSLAAIRADSVLLPGAAIAREGEALVLIGRSRSGKSSLAARALAAGLRVLGDDQVFLTARRECLPFPRRLRLYPDLARTAPAAFAALRPSVRRRLNAVGRITSLTRGYVAPPVSVSPSSLADGPLGSGPVTLGEVVVIQRAPVARMTFQALDGRELQADAEDVLREQRAKILSVTGVQAAYEPVLDQERAILSRVLAAAPARRVLVPDSWPSQRAVGALADALGVDR